MRKALTLSVAILALAALALWVFGVYVAGYRDGATRCLEAVSETSSIRMPNAEVSAWIEANPDCKAFVCDQNECACVSDRAGWFDVDTGEVVWFTFPIKEAQK